MTCGLYPYGHRLDEKLDSSKFTSLLHVHEANMRGSELQHDVRVIAESVRLQAESWLADK